MKPEGRPSPERLAAWCLAIAAAGMPSTALVLVLSEGQDTTAGAGAIGSISIAALATARSLIGSRRSSPAADSTVREPRR